MNERDFIASGTYLVRSRIWGREDESGRLLESVLIPDRWPYSTSYSDIFPTELMFPRDEEEDEEWDEDEDEDEDWDDEDEDEDWDEDEDED